MATFQELQKAQQSSETETGLTREPTLKAVRDELEKRRRGKLGVFGRIAEFLAPVTAKVIRQTKTGEDTTGRQLAGAAFEVGSFLLPSTAILKSAGLLARGAKALGIARAGKAVARVAEQTLPALTTSERLRGFGRGATQFGKETGKIGLVGGVTGALYEGAEPLAEERDPSRVVTDMILGGLSGTGVGLGLGAGSVALSPLVKRMLTKRGTLSSDGLKGTIDALNKLSPEQKEKVLEAGKDALYKSVVEEKTAINTQLKRMATDAAKEGGPNTPEGVVKEMIGEGVFPELKGSLMDFSESVSRIKNRQETLMNKFDELAQKFPDKEMNLTELKKEALNALETRPATRGAEIIKTKRHLEDMFLSWEETFKKDVVTLPESVRILRESNALTKAFDQPNFVQDAAESVGFTMRSRLNKLDKVFGETNKKWGQLERVQKTIHLFDNKKVDTGQTAKWFGRYGGTVGGSLVLAATGLGAGGLISGSSAGGLVIAGVAASMGEQMISKLVRSMRLNPDLRRLITEVVASDDALMNKLLKSANKADSEFLRRQIQDRLLPAPKEGVPQKQSFVPIQLPERMPPPETKLAAQAVPTKAITRAEEGLTLAPTKEAMEVGSGRKAIKPIFGTTQIKKLLTIDEFKKNPILTVIAEKMMEFQGKTTVFRIKPEAFGINKEKLVVGDKIRIDAQSIKTKGAPQQVRIFKNGLLLASIVLSFSLSERD